MCAKNLENDEDLHRIAEQRAHSEANGQRLPLPNDYNENVFEIDTGDPSNITGEIIVKSWYDQHQQYNPNNEASAPVFSQLVWKTSTKLGVGHAYNGQKLYVIVLYKPSGNIRGQFAANVGCSSNGQSYQANR